MTWTALAMIVSLASGAMIVRRFLAPPRRDTMWTAAAACTALGLGLAVHSLVYLVNISSVCWNDRRIMLIDLAALAILFAFVHYISRRRKNTSIGLPSSRSEPAARYTTLALLLAILFIAFGVFLCIRLSAQRPHGNWDAWAMWNSHAKFLYQGGADWKLGFGEELAGVHPDYPLFLPLTVARAWCYAAGAVADAPRFISIAFTALTAMLLLSGLAGLHNRLGACLATVCLVGSRVFVNEGAAQYADMPLSFFILATCVFLVAALGKKGSRVPGVKGSRVFAGDPGTLGPSAPWPLLSLAGLLAGCAAWTKNEGQLFCFAAAVALAVVSWASAGWRTALRRTALYVAGALPFLLVILACKIGLAWQSDLFTEEPLSQRLHYLVDPARYRLFAHWIAEILPQCIDPLLLAAMMLYLLVASVHAGVAPANSRCDFGRRSTHDRAAVAIAGLSIAIMAVGYAFIYLTTPYDLGWHMRTSFSRLFLHLWPSLIFVLFMAARNRRQESGVRSQKSECGLLAPDS